MAKILVTGAAGFIGMHTVLALLSRGDTVIGLDNFNAYYDPSLKHARVKHIQAAGHGDRFQMHTIELADAFNVQALFGSHQFDGVIHLAAQAGVRYSLDHPKAYIDSNILGFMNLLESIRAAGGVRHLVYASSSSVYGGNKKLPFAETDSVDQPVSLYAATKKANELMAHTYSHLFGIPATGLRFFTVYGPWGRPDMAAFLFTKAMIEGQPIKLFNHGEMSRDFTYIDDIVEGVLRVLDLPPVPLPSNDSFAFEHLAPHRVLNIGNHRPEALLEFVAILEEALGIKAIRDLQPIQPGDVLSTYAETSMLHSLTGFQPSTSLREGLQRFVAWYRGFYQGS